MRAVISARSLPLQPSARERLTSGVEGTDGVFVWTDCGAGGWLKHADSDVTSTMTYYVTIDADFFTPVLS